MDAVTLAIGSLLPKLRELLKEEYKLHKEVKDGISYTVVRLDVLLHRLAKMPSDQLDEQVKLQLDEQVKLCSLDVRELSYRIEDSVDGILNLQIGELNALQEVLQRLRRYEFDVAGLAPYPVDPRVLALDMPEEGLVGADEARDELIKMLTEGDDMSKQKRKIVSIVGFAGLGKQLLPTWCTASLESNSNVRLLFRSLLDPT